MNASPQPYPLSSRIALTEAMVGRMAAMLDEKGVSEPVLTAIKASWPGLRLTLCSDDDVGHARPVLEREGYRIYLVNGSNHCMTLTTDYDNAVGVVVAEVIEE